MIKTIKESFRNLNKVELIIYIVSEILIIGSFIISKNKNILSLVSSVLGATSLILLSKGDYLGHIISVIFGVIYIIISYSYKYYGEMFIYGLLMIPLAVTNIIIWKRNQASSHQVKIHQIEKKEIIYIFIITIIIGIIFYFILKWLNTTNLIISSISVMTSVSASLLSLKRSPYYAIMFILNDLVLITMWSLAAKDNPMYLPNVICFVAFLINDIYALVNWKKIEKKQTENINY